MKKIYKLSEKKTVKFKLLFMKCFNIVQLHKYIK